MTDFKAKMHPIRFRPPDPAWGAYSAPPDPQLDLGALLLRRGEGGKGMGGKEREGEGRGGGRKGRGGEGKGHEPPHYLEEVYAYENNKDIICTARHCTSIPV